MIEDDADLKRHRTLTDEDVTAIVERLRADMTKQFYNDLGRGVWAVVKSAVIAVALMIAAWGAVKSGIDLKHH